MKLPCRSVKLYKQESGVVVGNVVQTGLGGSASGKKLKMKEKK